MTLRQTLLLLLVFHASLATTAEFGELSPPPAPASPEPKNCPAKCGEIDIPYPFGVGAGCSLSGRFILTCNEMTSPPTLLTGTVKVASITLETAQMVVNTYLTYSCDVPTSNTTINHTSTDMALNVVTPFLLSPSENASLTPNLTQVSVEWENTGGRSPVAENLCQYAFVATKGWYSFRKNDLIGNMTFANRLGSGPVVPVVLDWAVRDGTCPPTLEGNGKEIVPNGAACVSSQSYCVNASHGAPGYFCNCTKGYTDIDECALRRSPNSTMYKNIYPCHGGTCHDTEGTIGAIALLFMLVIFLHMERENRKLRDRFNRNGGSFLKSAGIEIFTKDKLGRITNKYSCIIGKGAFGKVYKGTTDTGVVVAVKRSIIVNEDRQKDFANEITVQSKIRHPNLVRLMGCCLETEVPMLVYEFVPRGSLQDVLHGNNHPLPLETRVDIAISSAEGLNYMHSQSQMVLHGDVKSGNILIDDSFTPKVSDFGTSRLMCIDKDHTNWVVGDSSYIDPVYMKTGLLTAKSDVYSFGIVLLELVTRKKARYGENRSLPMDYVKASKDGTARQLFDEEVSSNVEENMECLEDVGKIAVQCLEEDVNNRPTMGEVRKELEKCKTQWLRSQGRANEVIP
ncbi:Wall-associated receptor kinase-like 2 [Triticum urartu]|uniref:Wall-associated receptor kinase-like 2 n=1 Tax=Triticum urartu TaxID=4572 RepID=M7ZJF1_TRIUA|nr:Wall-associated receptor kinase-like 2 [Triticum urartu]